MQMDRLVEEERALASLHGKPNAEAAEALKGRTGRSGASAPAINRAQRERSIDEWLARRKSGPPQHGPSNTSLTLVEPSSAARRGYSKGGAVVGGHGSSQSGSRGGSRSAPPELRSNKSAPTIFASAGGREIFDHVTKLSADRASVIIEAPHARDTPAGAELFIWYGDAGAPGPQNPSGEWDWEEHARFVEAYGFDPSA